MPQILKEEIKNRIYKAASKIFYKKGGNFYVYIY